ncbi:amino acid adenylation domain-containing protein (plasmid) [Rhizobium leguminosarum]
MQQLLDKLRADGVQLWVHEGRLRIRASSPLSAKRMAEIRANQADLMALLARPVVSRTTPLGELPKSAAPSLSYAQEGLWFLHQLGLLGSAYNLGSLTRIEGALDVAALRMAFDELVRRHEILRTRYRTIDGLGEPLVEAIAPARFESIDLSTEDADVRAVHLEEILRANGERHLDLERECPFAVQLLQTGDREYLLAINTHHIMMDGPSLAIMFRELKALYGAFVDENSVPLHDSREQYSDFAAWQRGWLRGDVLDAQLSYWRSRLADAPESLDLPFDFVRPPDPDHTGAAVEFALSGDLLAALQGLAKKLGATLPMLLLAAYQVLLSRWSGQKDVCVGCPIDARGHRDCEEIIGLFLNTVVMRADLTADPQFEDYLNHVRTHMLEAYEHRDLPFDRLVAELRPERHLARHPLVQAMFTYLVEDEPTLPGLRLTRIEPENRTAKFDLSLFFSETKDGLQAGFEYATCLFARTTIARLARHFITLLEGIVADHRARISELPLLEASERHRMLVEWNEVVMPFPQACIHELFEQQAASKPNATALSFGLESLSYANLNARANQLAHALRALGVGPDMLVGICLERSVDLVVGLLGILKAGAAYVPLDPVYPPARLALMLADSRASALVTRSNLIGLIPDHEVHTLCIDFDGMRIAAQATSNSPPTATPKNLACCIYTSGSTGRPKGIALQHDSVVASLTWAARTFGPDLERVLFSTSICFDLSIFELLAPLTSGGAVVMLRDAVAMSESLVVPAPSLINTVPSAAQALVLAGAVPSDVRVINLAGEPLRRDLVAQLISAAPQARVYNLYGPSENTVYTTFCELDGRDKVTIGRPVANTQIYLLDDNYEPVPIGSPGEVYVAGAGLARGYRDRAQLTAERFGPNPFGLPGSRMYRTGDLGRYLADGSIEFLGRIDHQVKIRGYRIELGEIESALRNCDGVEAAVVVASEDASGDRRLVAYVVAGHRSQASLCAGLQSVLPEYMVPRVFVFLDALPLMPNGKIDRKALSVPSVCANVAYVAPRTPTEALLCEIWSEVLKVPRVGIHDNFFELGGHSLLATQVVARIRRSRRTEVTLRELFISPTVFQLARIVSAAPTSADVPITPADKSLQLVASFAQQRMWFLDQLEPNSALYNVAVAWRLHGPLDLPALERAFNEILRRHEVLRTVFEGSDGTPVPIVLEPNWVPLTITDVSDADDPDRDATLLLDGDVARPFDLAHGPMMRVTLLHLRHQEYILMATLHHIVADGWSLDVLLTELAALYGAFVRGNPSPLQELAIQYSDYARWQRELLQGVVLEAHLSFWKRYLEGVPSVLSLPADRPRPQVSSYRGSVVPFTLSEPVSTALRALSQRMRVTLFMTMAAAFNVLLHRYSGQKDFCIGYSIGNRNRVEAEGLIGVFANTLVLRSRMAAEDSFAAELARVCDSMLEADTHADLPFEKLVEELCPDRDLSHHPIFQVAYSYSTTHGVRSRKTTTLPGLGQREVTLPGMEITLVEPDNQTAKFDLALFVSETGPGFGLEGDFEYSSDLFDRTTIERMVEHFRVLLESVVADPDTKIAELPLLTAEESRQVLEEWNATELQFDRADCVHQLFERQAMREPDAIALETCEEAISYADLNARANRCAHRLRSMGVGPDKLVGLCLDRSADMVIGLLAILKAGGAYVPIDPAYPAPRIAHIVADSRAAIIVTRASFADELVPQSVRTLCLDAEADVIAREPTADLPNVAAPANLAYCIYTSGSTGQPKGVLLTHANVVAFSTWMNVAFGPAEFQRTLFSTSICFDLSIFELFGPLVTGGTVVLVRDPLVLAETSLATPSLINLVPTAAQALLDAGAIPSNVSAINLAGEPLRPELASALGRAVPRARISNLYGPTEYTTYATWDEVGEGPILIGRPVANTQVYILDEHLRPRPLGTCGEIYLAGAGLARGYWNAPALTAEHFVPNPFGAPGCRMYWTGDLGRYRDGGRIEFLGRVDHQAKIRGHRVEPGEIEVILRQCPEVVEAAVVARLSDTGEQQLIAYFVGDGPLSEHHLRQHLCAQLPSHMIPSVFVQVDSLPLTPNGKLDRRALASLTPSTRSENPDYVAPRTSTEEVIAQIWAEVLQVPRVGIHEDFFALGGHSLLATRVIARIRQKLDTPLLLREIFAAPTVSALARSVRASHKVADEPIVPCAARHLPVPCSFVQQHIWLSSRLDPSGAMYNMPGAWRVDGPLDVSALQRALDEIVQRHEILRTSFTVEDGVPRQIIAGQRQAHLEVNALVADGNEAARLRELIEQEGGHRFDLASGPLLRARLIRINGQEHILLITLHHLVADGWSVDLLLNEMREIYECATLGLESQLPPLPIQYADFVLWQDRRLDEARLRDQLGYWSRYLAGARREVQLPFDRPRSLAPTYRGGWVELDLDHDVSERLYALRRQAQATHFMTMAAALTALLYRYSGQNDLCIGYPVANRDRAELQGLIGPLINMLVLRLRFGRAETFRSLLDQIRAAVLDGSAHQELPFDRLVQELQPERDDAHQPLFRIVLSTLEQSDPDLGGLRMVRLQPFDRTSKFDLTFFLADTANGIAGGIEYATDLFDESTVRRLAGHFSILVEAAAANPERRIDELPILTPSERRRLLHDCNDLQSDSAQASAIHGPIERWARDTPHARAVVSDDGSVSYAQLNMRANQFARYLAATGLGPEVPVAVCLDSSIELIVTLLGVLKTGAFYVPLDPELPAARLASLYAQSGAGVLVTRTEFRDRLQVAEGAVLLLDAAQSMIDQQATGDLQKRVNPENLIYCIFTSGSTGTPKGVEVTHAGVLNLLAWHKQFHEMRRGDHVSQLAGVSFDAHAWEVWAALTTGATLHLGSGELRRAPDKIPAWLEREQITHCFLPTPLAESVLAQAWANTGPLRVLLTGGDTLHRGARPDDHFALVNHYGPTECSVVVTAGIVPPRGGGSRMAPAIGRPIRGTQVHIVDVHGELTPDGVIGELCVSGVGLARGYRHDPKLTAERFVPNPFAVQPGARLYRTGDLGRRLANGEIELVGRMDQQVKLRGYRVEFGEIEALLAMHPSVQACVVATVNDATDAKQLVAYVVPVPESRSEPSDWRNHLHELLPEALVPSTYVPLDTLPLLPSGKIDRCALPPPHRLGTRASYVAPRNSLEETIARIWCELLATDDIGVHDNFFACGGQSLVVARAISRMREALGVDLSLRTFFDGPTVAELAERIETLQWISLEGTSAEPNLHHICGEV